VELYALNLTKRDTSTFTSEAQFSLPENITRPRVLGAESVQILIRLAGKPASAYRHNLDLRLRTGHTTLNPRTSHAHPQHAGAGHS